MKKYFKFEQEHYKSVLDKKGFDFFKNSKIEEMSRKIDDMVKFKLKYKNKESIKYEPALII